MGEGCTTNLGAVEVRRFGEREGGPGPGVFSSAFSRKPQRVCACVCVCVCVFFGGALSGMMVPFGVALLKVPNQKWSLKN